MWEWFLDSKTWIGLMQIIGINIVLSGDNAVVIALACRNLPERLQKKAIFLGSMGAIVLRVLLTAVAAYLMGQPYLQLIGGLLLVWIAVKLLMPEGEGDDEVASSGGIMDAVRTIVIADLIMSLDNVIGVAAAAKGDTALLIIGLGVSMPLIIYGSQILLGLMGRFPVLITFGGALLGYVAGETLLGEKFVNHWVERTVPVMHMLFPWLLAVSVVIAARVLAPRAAPEVVELSSSPDSKE